jgi:type II secretory pathway component GspD/PulD (secretin)
MSKKTFIILGLFMALAIAAAPVLAEPGGEKTSGFKTDENHWHLAQLENDKAGGSQENPSANLINLNFLDTDIRDALSALAMKQDINIATAKEVSGKISIHLFQVTLEEALHAITLAGGFGYYKRDGIFYIYKPKQEMDPQSERLQMRIFELRFAEIEKIQEILEAIPGMRTIKIHEPSKTIVVEDIPENIQKIETIISYWDTMPRQVLIEAKILEIKLTDDMQLGVDWSQILGDVQISTAGFSDATLPTTAPVSPVPAEAGLGVFANMITSVGTAHQFAAAIDALQSKTNVNSLSTPKVLAIHAKPAKVQVGGQQGYRVTTTNLGVATETIEFIDTGIVLELVPYIDNDGNVLLNVKPSITSAVLEAGIPVTNTTEVSTWMMTKSGQTILIGGLIQDSRTKTKEAIPCLGDIPGLSLLFGRNTRAVDKIEFAVLITPQVLVSGTTPLNQQPTVEKIKKMDESLKKEPLPGHKQIGEFLLPKDDLLQQGEED